MLHQPYCLPYCRSLMCIHCQYDNTAVETVPSQAFGCVRSRPILPELLPTLQRF